MPDSSLPNGPAAIDSNSTTSHPTDSTSTSTSAQTPSTDASPSHHHQQQQQQTQQQQEDNTKHPTTSTLRLSLPTVIAHCHHQVHSFLSESHPPNSLLATTQHQTRTSLAIIKDALTRYQLPELSLSYNGGKDCLVLLILFLASLHPHPPASAGGLASIPAIYALPPDPFPDVEDFVRWSSEAYHLSIDKFTTDPPTSTLRDAFDHYLALNPTIRAIFVGTRRTDPHGARLTHFDPTDSGWPDFVRIHPVIDWHYAQIWAFIRHLDLRYCPLYDQGYTSLGGTTDTLPNPKLRTDGPDGEDEYRPAYELTEDLEERLGRN
ncbi:FAD synthase [Aspergillus candidus]|uniref:FAD synthase n=1 Tax=Aspergillus candidus TaxID=41067 RepID=A0A2I2EZU0_ASPCN|nr:FAD synthetase [Aspergillus candidus]PLB33899.1 FAD synthetase [Aspergillus candidus]